MQQSFLSSVEPSTEVEPEISWFARLMQTTLDLDQLGGSPNDWHGYHYSEVLKKITKQSGELKEQLMDQECVSESCARLANWLMVLANKSRCDKKDDCNIEYTGQMEQERTLFSE